MDGLLTPDGMRRAADEFRATYQPGLLLGVLVAGSGLELEVPSVPVEARFYGPCESCRTELRDRFRSEGRIVDVAEYEPKMNVTPNAVALKD